MTVADARFAKPLDEALILDLAGSHEVLVTLEEGSVGGFGAMVLHLLSSRGALDDGTVRVRTLTLPDSYQEHDTPDRMYAEAGPRRGRDRQDRRGDPAGARDEARQQRRQRRPAPALNRNRAASRMRPGPGYLITAQAMRAPALPIGCVAWSSSLAWMIRAEPSLSSGRPRRSSACRSTPRHSPSRRHWRRRSAGRPRRGLPDSAGRAWRCRD